MHKVLKTIIAICFLVNVVIVYCILRFCLARDPATCVSGIICVFTSTLALLQVICTSRDPSPPFVASTSKSIVVYA